MAVHWSNTRLITFCNSSNSSTPTLVSHLLKKNISHSDDQVPYPSVSVSVSPDFKSSQLDVQIDEARAEETEIHHFSRSLAHASFEANHDGNQHLLLSLLSIMLGGFLKTLWPSTILLDEPFVALPKHPVNGYDPLIQVSSTGKVTQLVLFAYEEHLDSDDGMSAADDYEVEDASPPIPRRPSASEFCARDQWGRRSPLVLISEGPGSRSSVCPLSETGTELDSPADDFFSQGSILTGRYTALDLMGIICAGTSESLWGTMASMLYQRRSWGIEEPVFGILLRHASTKATAIVSWLSEETNQGNLPSVHATIVAHYDLSSPAESFAFACLLRRLGDHVSDVQTQFSHVVGRWNTEGVVPAFLSWRADLFANASTGTDYLEPDERIRTWLVSCSNCPGYSTTGSPEIRDENGEQHEEDGIYFRSPNSPNQQSPSAISLQKNQPVQTELSIPPQSITRMERRKPSSESSGSSDDIRPSSESPRTRAKHRKAGTPNSGTVTPKGSPAGSNAASATLQVPQINVPQKSTNPSTPTKSEQRYSCSEFCLNDYEKDGKSKGIVAKWLGQRNIFPMVHPFVEILNYQIPGECTGPHTVDYDNWTALPRDSLQTLLKSITAPKERRVSDELEFLRECLDKPELKFVSTDSMSPAVRSNIENRLDALLRVSIYAYDKKVNSITLNVSEANLRTCWDALMALCSISDGSDCKIESSVEEMIRLPLNTNLAALRVAKRGRLSNTNNASSYGRWKNLISSTWDSPLPIVEDLEKIYNNDGGYLPLRVYKDLEEEDHVKHYDWVTQVERLHAQFNQEPRQARVDGIVTLAVPLFETVQDCQQYDKELRDLALILESGNVQGRLPTVGTPEEMMYFVQKNEILRSSRRQAAFDRPCPPSTTPSSQPTTKSEMLQSSNRQIPFDRTTSSESVDIPLRKNPSRRAAQVQPKEISYSEEDSDYKESSASESAHSEYQPGSTDSEVSDSEHDTTDRKAASRSQSNVGNGILRLPVMLQEYKKFVKDNKLSAVNQGRLDIAAALKFLASLGIYDYSVYTIITDGVFGLLCYGFMEKQAGTVKGKHREDEEVHKRDMGLIFEHNTRLFDISSPVDVFNLAIAIGNICTKNAAILRTKFGDVADGLRQDFASNMHDQHSWSLASQIKSMKPTGPVN